MQNRSTESGTDDPSSIDSLVGRSPAELREHNGPGKPAEHSALGRAPKGRLLAIEPLARAHAAIRPALSLVSRRVVPWQGKGFNVDGSGGHNRVLGFEVLGFRSERGPSAFDGRPTLFLRYDEPSLCNSWPFNRIVDELRMVAGGLAVGPASLRVRGRSLLLFWWGLEAVSAGR